MAQDDPFELQVMCGRVVAVRSAGDDARCCDDCGSPSTREIQEIEIVHGALALGLTWFYCGECEIGG